MALYNDDLMSELDGLETSDKDSFEFDNEEYSKEDLSFTNDSQKLNPILDEEKNEVKMTDEEASIFLAEIDPKWMELFDRYMMEKGAGNTSAADYAMWIQTLPEYKEEQKVKENGNDLTSGKPKTLTLANPNIPQTVEPTVSSLPKQEDTSFFKAFVFTAITCGLLMSAYMFVLF